MLNDIGHSPREVIVHSAVNSSVDLELLVLHSGSAAEAERAQFALSHVRVNLIPALFVAEVVEEALYWSHTDGDTNAAFEEGASLTVPLKK